MYVGKFMKVLVALPTQYPPLACLDDVIVGKVASSGTISSFIRSADFLATAGIEVVVSSACDSQSNRFSCIRHDQVDSQGFDWLIAHQSHWNGTNLTFGNDCLQRSILWLHNQTSWSFVDSFLKAGGYRVVCPSAYLANHYRALSGWLEKIAVISNSYASVFAPTVDSPARRLLFIGAITPSKGFTELMQIWSYLVTQNLDLEFAIAGGIRLHSSDTKLGDLGVADYKYEKHFIQPWYDALPAAFRPYFLGSLPPVDLQREIAQAWAVIVNPCWHAPETFAVSAVEAQACNRTVFGVMAGGLGETVYRGSFQSLTRSHSPKAVGDLILQGIKNPNAVAENGRLAGEFVRSRFSPEAVATAWIDLLHGKTVQPESLRSWSTPMAVVQDLMRWTGTGLAAKTVYGKFRERSI